MDIRRQTVLSESVETQLRRFLQESAFAACGGIVTDLDGTVVHEVAGKVYLPKPVEFALKELYDLGRAVMINSLRFPLSVLRTFGQDWYRISNAPIPTISLNGSQFGFLIKTKQNELVFDEIASHPLSAAEIEEILQGVGGLLDDGITDLLVFYYPRDWHKGELIWTPVEEKVAAVQEKYRSASLVSAVEFTCLCERLQMEEICMMMLLIDAPEDTLMAYQHSKRSNVFSHKGTDKLSGSEALAKHLGVSLADSIGAGDTEMDRFLNGVGLAIIVGGNSLEYKGLTDTIKLQDSFELGEFLFRLAGIQRELIR